MPSDLITAEERKIAIRHIENGRVLHAGHQIGCYERTLQKAVMLFKYTLKCEELDPQLRDHIEAFLQTVEGEQP